MPAPVYSSGAYGNLINAVSVTHGTTIAAFLDLSAAIEGQVNCEVVTGASPPTAGTAFSAYRAYGINTGTSTPTAPFTQGATTAPATSLTLTAVAAGAGGGLHAGQKIALQQASGSKLGEVVTISAVSGSGPYTVTVSATINSYSSGDYAYLMGQTTVASVTPASTAGTWAASTDYSAPLYLGTGIYVLAAANADGTNNVTASASMDKITSFA
jgi:hypothetical protein